jgi:hypothetical protein
MAAWRRTTGVTMLLFGMGCTIQCTLVACESALVVRLSSVPSGPFRIELADGDLADGEVIWGTYECPDVATCQPSATFHGLSPANATVIVTYDGRRGEPISRLLTRCRSRTAACPADPRVAVRR